MKRDGSWEILAGGLKRRLVAVGENLMTMEVRFEAGAVGALHQHPQEQFTVAKAGRFRFTLGGQILELAAGDSVFIAGGVPHGAEALEAGTLLDTFSPLREDLLED